MNRLADERLKMSAGCTILPAMNCIVTAGPTCEPLDEVRRLTNFSTGRLGTELANFLAARGHKVTLLVGEQATYSLKPGRYAWVQVATGGVTLNGNALKAGDGAAVGEETRLTVKATEPSELLLFDLA